MPVLRMKKKPTIGIIGGGQLGRMFVEEALRYNITCIIADADPECPAARLADEQVVGSLAETETLMRLAQRCDVLTYEIEHIFVDPLLDLHKKENKKLIPWPEVLLCIQDKGQQKLFLQEHGIPTAAFHLIDSGMQWKEVVAQTGWHQFVLKTRRQGYDGRGVAVFRTDEVHIAPNSRFDVPCVVEEFVPCEKEIAVLAARSVDGQTAFYPLVEMEMDKHLNLIGRLLCPARVEDAIAVRAYQVARQTLDALASPGLFAMEMFLTADGHVLMNEIAPRPHNSGHHTIEACYTSQFEQLLRILLELPLGSTQLIKPAVMLNILGSPDFSGPYYLSGYDQLLQEEGLYVHLYGKKQARPHRKLGHITILGDTLTQALDKARKIESVFAIKKLDEHG